PSAGLALITTGKPGLGQPRRVRCVRTAARPACPGRPAGAVTPRGAARGRNEGGAVFVVVMGCGRVGSSLARALVRIGHEVTVIDRDSSAFLRLGDDFAGQRVVGVGFDRDVLTRAGVGRADAFAAVSSGDNSNIISARVARETFGVERVVARIYDAKRAAVYERLGIPTI